MTTIINHAIRLEYASENALMLYFSANDSANLKPSTTINASINTHVQQAVTLIRQRLSQDIIDLIPSYASILVMFDLNAIDHHRLRNRLKALLQTCENPSQATGKIIELPVYYSNESGQDLARITQHAKLSSEQVIALHQAQEYRVYAIGFAPGFAYLGEVDERIATPRLATPRLKVPKGAVAIADRQTAVYPSESPGGWNIIGLCPIDMFNPEVIKSMPVEVGDCVRFVAIDRDTYLELGGEIPIN